MSVRIEVELDFAFLGSMSFTLTETGGGGATGSISVTSAEGPYFLRTDMSASASVFDSSASSPQYSDLVTILKNKLDAVGNATYTVSFNTATQRLTIAATGGSVTAFALTSFNGVAQRVLGYLNNKTGAMTYTADRAPYYWISTTQGGLTDYSWDQEEDSDLATDMIAHDGTAYGIAKPGAPILFQATVPMEPKEIVQEHFATSLTPYTWQRFFRDTRNTLAYLVRFDDDNVNHTFALRNRAEGARFVPKLSRKDWWDYSDIKLDARVLNSDIDAEDAPAWEPSDLGSSLRLWLQPSGLSGSTWSDSSGNGYTFTATGSPGTAVVNGLTVADLNGSSQYFTSSATLGNIIGSGVWHLYAVCLPDVDFTDTGGSQNAVLADASGYWAAGGWLETSVNKVAHYNWDGSAKFASVSFTSNQIVCIETSMSGGNLLTRATLTSSSSSIASTASGATLVTTGTMRVGANWSLSQLFNGKVCEVIVFNRALTTGEQASARAYIADKWAIYDSGTVLY